MSKKDEIVLSYEDTLLRESDLKLLNPRQWLNDRLISFYFSYLKNNLISTTEDDYLLMFPEMAQLIKSCKHSPSMINELRVMFNDDYFAKKSVWFIPINDARIDEIGGSHWSLLVYHKKTKTFEHYDSLANSNNKQEAETVSRLIQDILGDIYESKFLEEGETTKQTNSFDCGIHLLCNCEALVKILFLKNQEKFTELTSKTAIDSKREEIKSLILSLKDKN